MHPMLIPFPIAFLVATLACDVAFWWTRAPAWATATVWLLGFESVLNRDYAVVFATLYIFSLIGLLVNLIADLTYTWVDPRIDFETRET